MFNMIYTEIWLQLSRLEAAGVYQDVFSCGGYWVRVRGARGHENIGRVLEITSVKSGGGV